MVEFLVLGLSIFIYELESIIQCIKINITRKPQNKII